jgi:hypothetical protein
MCKLLMRIQCKTASSRPLLTPTALGGLSFRRLRTCTLRTVQFSTALCEGPGCYTSLDEDLNSRRHRCDQS